MQIGNPKKTEIRKNIKKWHSQKRIDVKLNIKIQAPSALLYYIFFFYQKNMKKKLKKTENWGNNLETKKNIKTKKSKKMQLKFAYYMKVSLFWQNLSTPEKTAAKFFFSTAETGIFPRAGSPRSLTLVRP